MLSQAQVSICHYAEHQISKEVRCLALTLVKSLPYILVDFNQLTGMPAGCTALLYVLCLFYLHYFVDVVLAIRVSYIYSRQPASLRLYAPNPPL